MREPFHDFELLIVVSSISGGTYLIGQEVDHPVHGVSLPLVLGAFLLALALVTIPGTIRTYLALRQWKRKAQEFESRSAAANHGR